MSSTYATCGKKTQDYPVFCYMYDDYFCSENCHLQKHAKLWQKYWFSSIEQTRKYNHISSIVDLYIGSSIIRHLSRNTDDVLLRPVFAKPRWIVRNSLEVVWSWSPYSKFISSHVHPPILCIRFRVGLNALARMIRITPSGFFFTHSRIYLPMSWSDFPLRNKPLRS